jgi:purine catabolism regulator
MLTVEDLIRTTLGPDAIVVAGHGSLGVEVTWAAALRPRPPAFDGLKGGELAIVSLGALRQLDDRMTLARLIDQIAGLGVVAVAVAGLIDEDAIQAGERLGLPLIQLPETTSSRDLETRVTRAIVDSRADLQRRGQDLYHQFLELVISGRGTDAVIAKLAELTGRPAILEDASSNVLTIRLPAGDSADRAQPILRALAQRRDADSSRLQSITANAADPPTIRVPVDEDGLARLVAPVGSAAAREGYVSILGPATELTTGDRLAVSRAAAACAIVLARDRQPGAEIELRLTELLDDLIAGAFASEAALLSRASRLGLDLAAPHLAVAIRGVGADGLPANRSVERLLRRELVRRSLPPAVRSDRDVVVAVIPATVGREALRVIVGQLREGIAGLGGRLAAGVSRPACGLPGLRDAIRIAEQALDLAIRRDGPDATLIVEHLGADELLLSLGPLSVLSAFRDEWLGRLAAYDARNHGQLVQTLAAYIDSHHSATEAAENLHVHRNTLLYRLQRIREITGRDPDDPTAQLALHLALRIDAVFGSGVL